MKLSDNQQTVLIVDDNPDNLYVIDKALRKLDVNIIKATSGKEALIATIRSDVSLVLLDIMMPDLNGYEIAEELKKDKRTAEIPIIFITALDKSDSLEIKGYSKGAVDVIYKPFNEIILRSKVKALLELYKMKTRIDDIIKNQTIMNPKILIVDDVPENLFAMEKLLNKLDVEIIKASSGNEALSCTLDHDFALIILDVQMPQMDGYEVGEILKYEDRTASIPIIFVTAIDRDIKKEIKGYDSGAIDFIFKPLNEYILLCKVQNFIEMYKMRVGLETLVAEQTVELKERNRILKDEVIKSKKYQEELKKAKSYLNDVINSMPSVLIGIDADGCITNMNAEAEKIAGVEFAKIKGKSLIDVFPSYAQYIGEVEEIIKNKTCLSKDRILQMIDNKFHLMNMTVYSLLTAGMEGAVIRIDDVTEKIRLEEMIVQTEKMMSVGGLAAGMAHEINNPLAVIIQGVQNINRRLSPDFETNKKIAEEIGIDLNTLHKYLKAREVNDFLKGVTDAGIRASEIVKNMLNFSRASEPKFLVEDINNLIDNTIELLSHDYNFEKKYDFKKMEIIRDYDTSIKQVSCIKSEIQQVILNLLKNGAQIMNAKLISHLDRTGPKREDGYPELYKPQFHIKTYHKKSSVVIEIKDNGPGMNEEIKKRVFEPFFTTKKIGQGTGLGLSVSYFIITQNHKGRMSVESEPGRGARFIIELPM